MKCADVMTTEICICLSSDTITDAARTMRDAGVGPVPVVDDLDSRKAAGILTDRDIVVTVVAEGIDPGMIRVRDVMSRDLVTCRVDDDVQIALDAMAHHQVRRVLVVDEAGSLCGIISQADVATRVDDSKKTGKIVREISQPSVGA